MQPPYRTKNNFHKCPNCGMKLLERLENGLWRFVHGEKPQAVTLLILGSVKVRCWGKGCGWWSTFYFFPEQMTKGYMKGHGKPAKVKNNKRKEVTANGR